MEKRRIEGFCLVMMAHAQFALAVEDPVDTRMAGIEIIDFADQIYERLAGRQRPWPRSPSRDRLYAFPSLYHRPHAVFELRDAVSAQRPFVGIFASIFTRI